MYMLKASQDIPDTSPLRSRAVQVEQRYRGKKKVEPVIHPQQQPPRPVCSAPYRMVIPGGTTTKHSFESHSLIASQFVLTEHKSTPEHLSKAHDQHDGAI